MKHLPNELEWCQNLRLKLVKQIDKIQKIASITLKQRNVSIIYTKKEEAHNKHRPNPPSVSYWGDMCKRQFLVG